MRRWSFCTKCCTHYFRYKRKIYPTFSPTMISHQRGCQKEMLVFLTKCCTHCLCYKIIICATLFSKNGHQHGRQNEMLVFLHQMLYTLPILQKNNMCNFFPQNGRQHCCHRQTPLRVCGSALREQPQ